MLIYSLKVIRFCRKMPRASAPTERSEGCEREGARNEAPTKSCHNEIPVKNAGIFYGAKWQDN